MNPELIATGFAFLLLLAKMTMLALKGQLGQGTFLLSAFFSVLFWGGVRPIADAMSGQGYIRIWDKYGRLTKYSRDKNPNAYAFVLIICFATSMAIVVAAFVVPPIDLLRIEVVD
tara:strand:- start:631 stop:975 length:345 start_codon:yes stop_codon:yes gene_type:complete